MWKGSTFVEFLIYMTIAFLIFSLTIPNVRAWMERTGSIAEIKGIKNSIRYARFLSFLKNNKVEVHISQKNLKVMLDKKIVKTSPLNFVKIEGNKCFAFSKGVPYISGTLNFFVNNSFVAKISVTPVIGKINLAWK